MAESRELSIAECERLLRSGDVGRVAFATADGPFIVPVNYSVSGGAVIVATSPYSALGTLGRDALFAFEVDHLEPGTKEGWSVVARGRAEPIGDPEEVDTIRHQQPPRPWVDGPRNLYLRLRWTELSGRRLGALTTGSELGSR
jgi:nitroimidazol reductase NimA-like FMN-containing flavoprotein (pyridoxamine 5'-phosphate oxidase superfamily)